jgi:hypothetical protein
MLEIFIIAWLIISIPVTIFFLLAFTAAGRADHYNEGVTKIYSYKQPREKKAYFKRSFPYVHF